MSDVRALAQALGVARTWIDVDGIEQAVGDDKLARIVAALGYPAGSAKQIDSSLARVMEEARQPPALLVGVAGEPTSLPTSLTRAELIAEDGTAQVLPIEGWTLPAIAEPGYYRLALGGHELTLAIAPPTCFSIDQLGPRRMWGPAIQIPALRGDTPQAFGDFGDLNETVRLFAQRGADAVAINPVHALFPGCGTDFSPYSPSSRLFLNGAMGDPALVGLPPLPAGESGDLIDWEGALPRRLADLRTIFAGLDDGRRAAILAACRAEGPALQRHGLFDALDVHFRAQGLKGWRQWPTRFQDPAAKEVKLFAAQQSAEVDFHLFVQWLARESLATVQRNAKAAGMAIGLLADLAVGVHTGGSDSWALREAMLDGLTIGAPPDPLGPHGQNWALTSFSPNGLRASGYAPWIAMIRAALSSAGGLRIDHAFGLARLWVVPEGEESSAGAYLTYPFQDLLRLAALESHRARALIVAEDLGTMPLGFGDAIKAQQMLGMRVLWFERATDRGFIGAQDYPEMAVAMTGTHDTPTVAGWWTGRDLDWAEKLGRLPEGVTREAAELERAWDRGLLWASIDGSEPRPEPDDPAPVVASALRHIGRAPSRLAIAPLEDLLGIEEQPNLPGTVTEHPNWRRRLGAPTSTLLDEDATASRIATLDTARKNEI